MRFEFATAGRIIFGPGAQEELGTMAGELGEESSGGARKQSCQE